MKLNIGQYIPANSIIHRLDPRTKIISLILLLVALFIIPVSTNNISLILLGVIFGLALILNISAKVPIRKLIISLKPLTFLLTFTFIIQMFTIKDGISIFNNPLTMHLSLTSLAAIIVLIILYNIFKKGLPFRTTLFFILVFLIFYLQYLLPYGKLFSYSFNPTYDALIRGGFLFFRIMTTILLTSLLTFTTMTTDLNYGFEYILSPLKIFKVRVEVFAMMLSLILRYIPTLLFETEKIIKAQASRGLDFNESKLKDKIMQIIALLIPIFIISITRAEELSDAMEARGYVLGAKRTRIDEYKFRFGDFFGLVLSVLVVALFITFRYI